jgi:hypothetical protein
MEEKKKKNANILDTKEIQKQVTGVEQVTNSEKVMDARRKQKILDDAKEKLNLGYSEDVEKVKPILAEEGIRLTKAGKLKEANTLLDKIKSVAAAGAKKGLKALPVVGGIASAIAERKAEAALPVFGDSDDLGPKKGSEGAMIEDPSISSENRNKIKERLRKRLSSSKE